MNITRKCASILLVLALLCGLTAVAARGAYEPGAKFVVLGDSIAYGQGASDLSKSYGRMIAANWGFALENYAVSGHTSSNLLGVLTTNDLVRDAVSKADIINISIGGNDWLTSDIATILLRRLFLNDTGAATGYLETFRGNFTRIIEEIRGLNEEALLIVHTLYNPTDDLPLVGGLYDEAVSGLNKRIYEYLESHPGAFEIADIYTFFKTHSGEYIYRDRTHPNDAGYARIALVVNSVIAGEPLPLPCPAGPQLSFFQKVAVLFRALIDILDYALST